MDDSDFTLEIGKNYTVAIEWNGQEDSENIECELRFRDQTISIKEFGKYLNTLEGWKIDLKLRED